VNWEDEVVQRIISNCAQIGMDDKEISRLLGVHVRTLQNRVRQIPELEESLMAGRAKATQMIVSQMFRAAMGGHIYQEVIESIDKTGARSVRVVTREAPPNPLLMIFWLTNRDPETWKHMKQLVHEQKSAKQINPVLVAEADRILELGRSILSDDSEDAEGEPSVSTDPARDTGQGTGDAETVSGDVPPETGDCV